MFQIGVKIDNPVRVMTRTLIERSAELSGVLVKSVAPAVSVAPWPKDTARCHHSGLLARLADRDVKEQGCWRPPPRDSQTGGKTGE